MPAPAYMYSMSTIKLHSFKCTSLHKAFKGTAQPQMQAQTDLTKHITTLHLRVVTKFVNENQMKL